MVPLLFLEPYLIAHTRNSIQIRSQYNAGAYSACA